MQRYLRSWSTLAFFLPACLILLAVAERAMTVGQNFWLSIWTDATAASAEDHEQLNNAMYLGIYFALGIVPVFVQVLPPVHPLPLLKQNSPKHALYFKVVHQNMLLNAVPLLPSFSWHIFILSFGPACALRPSHLAKVLCSPEVLWLCRKMQQMGVKFSMIDICQLQIWIRKNVIMQCMLLLMMLAPCDAVAIVLAVNTVSKIPSDSFLAIVATGNRCSCHLESIDDIGSYALGYGWNWYHNLMPWKDRIFALM